MWGEGRGCFDGAIVSNTARSAVSVHSHFTAYPHHVLSSALSTTHIIRATFTIFTKMTIFCPSSSTSSTSFSFSSSFTTAEFLSTFAAVAHTQQMHALLGGMKFSLISP